MSHTYIHTRCCSWPTRKRNRIEPWNRDANQWMLWRRFCGRYMLSLFLLLQLVLLTPLFLSALQPNSDFFGKSLLFCLSSFTYSECSTPQPRALTVTRYIFGFHGAEIGLNWLGCLLVCMCACDCWAFRGTRLSVPSRSWHPHGIPYRLHNKWHSVYVRPAIKYDIDRASHHPNHDSVCGQNHCRY